MEILKAMGRIASGKYLDFLKHEFLYSTNFDVRMNAARSIIKHNTNESRVMVNELMATVTNENQLILKHCNNPLIKY